MGAPLAPQIKAGFDNYKALRQFLLEEAPRDAAGFTEEARLFAKGLLGDPEGLITRFRRNGDMGNMELVGEVRWDRVTPTRLARIDTTETVNTISVDDSSLIRVGELVLIWDVSGAAAIAKARRVTAVGAGTVTVDGAAVSVADDDIIYGANGASSEFAFGEFDEADIIPVEGAFIYFGANGLQGRGGWAYLDIAQPFKADTDDPEHLSLVMFVDFDSTAGVAPTDDTSGITIGWARRGTPPSIPFMSGGISSRATGDWAVTHKRGQTDALVTELNATVATINSTNVKVEMTGRNNGPGASPNDFLGHADFRVPGQDLVRRDNSNPSGLFRTDADPDAFIMMLRIPQPVSGVNEVTVRKWARPTWSEAV
jgi:hypothetical protein